VFDYGEVGDPRETMSVEEFVGLLDRWRAVVIDAQRQRPLTGPDS
jgi:hypothetical protein